MAYTDVTTTHEFHLKDQPTVPYVPFTYATPIHVRFEIEVKFYSTLDGNVTDIIYECDTDFTGYTTGYRPCITLSCGDQDNPGFFGIYTSAGGGVFTNLDFKAHIKINDIPQPDVVYNTFTQDGRLSGAYLIDATIDVLEANIPIIFDTEEVPTEEDPEEHYYTKLEWDTVAATVAPDLHKILNWEDTIPEGSSFFFKAMYGQSTWINNNQPAVSQIGWQGYRGTIIEGTVNLVKVPGVYDGKLVYRVNSDAVFYNLEKTTDGVSWTSAASLPDYLYRKHENELGTFFYALQTEYDNILDPESPNEPQNETGEEDDGEDWGDVYTKSFFTQQYLCPEGAIQEISNALYDITPGGLWEDIKKGLEMFGSNPMDAVVNLTYYPIDLSSIYSNVTSSADIWFGGYKFTMQSHSAYKLVYPDGYFYCGGVTIRPKYKGRKDAWRDVYATRLFVDLPYCGRYELDPAKYYNKFIKVIYYIDLKTGSCVACLVNNSDTSTKYGNCLDSFNGQIGTQLPITLTDFSAYANAQINTLLGNGGQAMISGGQQVGNAMQAIGSGAGAMAAVGVGAAALGAIQGAKTVYGLQQNNINRFNQTRGGATAMLNQYLNQKPRFIFEYRELDIPDNFYEMNGGPSNYSGTVGGFSGYFEAEQVKLNMPGATQNEKEKARALIMGGVFI